MPPRTSLGTTPRPKLRPRWGPPSGCPPSHLRAPHGRADRTGTPQLTLIEIAPGLDLQRDVLAACGAPVAVADDLRLMDECIFRAGPLRL